VIFSETFGLSFSTRETVAMDTPAFFGNIVDIHAVPLFANDFCYDAVPQKHWDAISL